jgi:D,D-heptose 1,7-bisphosphate phosphatase
MEKAVFLDKDGTLIHDVPYNIDSEKIVLYEGVGESLLLLQDYGFKIIVVTNQPGVAYGYFEEKMLKTVFDSISGILLTYSVKIDDYYYCPHHPQGKVEYYTKNCLCRKPGAGLILQAAKDWNINLSQSWMIGDILNDTEAGNRAGCRSILIDNGNETEWIMSSIRKPAYTVNTFAEAIERVLSEDKRGTEEGEKYEGAI